MASSGRVAVTSFAWTTSLGNEVGGVWDALLSGQTGLTPVPSSVRLRNTLAAEVRNISGSHSERLIQMTCSTIERALEWAGCRASDPGVQLVLGTSLGAFLDEAESRQDLSTWATEAARRLGATPPIVISTACSSGSDAIMVGAELVRNGRATCCVCGGADVITPNKRLAHSALSTMSPSTLRAFDVRHDGTLLGEGAGILVLEEDTRACKPLAFYRGGGAANDASGMTVADITGTSAAYAIERSLLDAGLSPDDIGLINAHGSGTVMNDTTECNALNRIFGDRKRPPLVFATKGNFGHTLGATGAIEAITLILALESQKVPPIAGLDQPISEFNLPLAMTTRTSTAARTGLSMTLGFGGFDTSLIFEAA